MFGKDCSFSNLNKVKIWGLGQAKANRKLVYLCLKCSIILDLQSKLEQCQQADENNKYPKELNGALSHRDDQAESLSQAGI